MKPEELKEESLQNTQLYKDFKKALNINHDMRPGDNPFVVACINIAKQYALSLLPSDEEINEFIRLNQPARGGYADDYFYSAKWVKNQIINKLKS